MPLQPGAGGAARVFAKLVRHDIGLWAWTGGFAWEFHAAQLGLEPALRPWNDFDFVASSFGVIPESLAGQFLFRHVHPFDPPGKMLLQMVDAEAAVRIDVFRAYGRTMDRSAAGMVALEDLIARTARLLLDLGAGKTVAAKHARDYLRFAGYGERAEVEAAWRDHRKPEHPVSFVEADIAVRRLVAAREDLLITPEYSKDTRAVCPRCVAGGVFALAQAEEVLAVLGYC